MAPRWGSALCQMGEAQHLGLGRRLVAEAKARARAAGYDRLAVISAIRTLRYYENLGFTCGEFYMTTTVDASRPASTSIVFPHTSTAAAGIIISVFTRRPAVQSKEHS